jgi:glycosyltransferase involved in cell wall biosynthesis
VAETSRGLPVARPGYVPEALRNSLYSHCLALVLPSLYEGFGLPLLEAFTAGAPAICSTAGSLPEVAGNAALLVEPTDEGALAAALRRLAHDESLRSHLSARGRVRAAAFTWARAARWTREVYERA